MRQPPSGTQESAHAGRGSPVRLYREREVLMAGGQHLYDITYVRYVPELALTLIAANSEEEARKVALDRLRTEDGYDQWEWQEPDFDADPDYCLEIRVQDRGPDDDNPDEETPV